jgi:hypothetical protein
LNREKPLRHRALAVLKKETTLLQCVSGVVDELLAAPARCPQGFEKGNNPSATMTAIF